MPARSVILVRNLIEHSKSVHSEERLFSCPQCQHRYRTKGGGGGQAHETEYPLFLAKWAWALMGIDGHGQKI